jgi:hypothetical protein
MANAFGFCNEMKMSGDDRGYAGWASFFGGPIGAQRNPPLMK